MKQCYLKAPPLKRNLLVSGNAFVGSNMCCSDTVGLMVCKHAEAHVDGGSVQDTAALGSLGMVAGAGSTLLAALIIRNIRSS